MSSEKRPMLLTKSALARELGISRVTLDEILFWLQANGLKSINIRLPAKRVRTIYRFTRDSLEKAIHKMEQENN
jgi:DNA-binding GntR family transcriptional regulator